MKEGGSMDRQANELEHKENMQDETRKAELDKIALESTKEMEGTETLGEME